MKPQAPQGFALNGYDQAPLCTLYETPDRRKLAANSRIPYNAGDEPACDTPLPSDEPRTTARRGGTKPFAEWNDDGKRLTVGCLGPSMPRLAPRPSHLCSTFLSSKVEACSKVLRQPLSGTDTPAEQCTL